MIEEKIKQIDPKKNYNVHEVAKMEVFLNTKGEGSIFTLYRLIRNGRLPVQDVGSAGQPRYLLLGQDLINELNKRLKR